MTRSATVSLILIMLVSTEASAMTCPGDNNGDGETTVDEIMTAVVAALNGCASAVPTPTCPLPPAGRTCPPYEIYNCVTDESGCSVCDCCNFEGVGGCCQLADGCFHLINGGDAAECVVNRQGYIFSGCPIPATCDASTARCKQLGLLEGQATCAGDQNRDGVTTVDEIVQAVTAALYGCAEETLYRLGAGSTIAFVPEPGAASSPEPLVGTFTVTTARPQFNTFFAFTVLDVAFQAPSGLSIGGGGRFQCSGFDVDPGVGCIDRSTFEPEVVAVSLGVSIGEDILLLKGRMLIDDPLSEIDPPVFSGLEICGSSSQAGRCDSIKAGLASGYLLTVFAVPEIR